VNEIARPTIRYTELPELAPGEVFRDEWDTYRREVSRLLADGQEGKFVLIKGRQIIGLYDTWDTARLAGLGLYLMEPFLVQKILSEESIFRTRGYSLPCPIRSPTWWLRNC
jgi:hypothetical protein